MHTGLSLFAKWALVGAVAGVVLFGANNVVGQQRAQPPARTFDDWRYTIDYDRADWPSMRFTVSVTNTAKQARNLVVRLKLVRTDFKGNPASRVLLPKDIATTDLESKDFASQRLGPDQKATFVASFKTKPDAASGNPSLGISSSSYTAKLQVNGTDVGGVRASTEPGMRRVRPLNR